MNTQTDKAPKASDSAREPRAMQAKSILENRTLSDEEALKNINAGYANEVLPDLPEIPGYRTCWLSLTHERDTIPSRVRVGYQPVRPEDVPGYEFLTLKSGEYAGLVGNREMVAFKIPEKLYQRIMEINHHERPFEQEQQIAAAVQAANARTGKNLLREIGDGTAEFLSGVNGRKKPKFA